MTTSLESKLPKRTLIIGAAGFLGYAVGKKLADKLKLIFNGEPVAYAGNTFSRLCFRNC